MNNLAQAVRVELLKARRSRVPLFTALGFAMIPLSGGFFMVVLKDPELARRVGMISMKAELAMGAADWNTYLNYLLLAVGAGGQILFGIITAWVFGREYSDHTIKDLLALPTSRTTIVISKCILVALWSYALTVMCCLLTLGVGAALELPPQPASLFVQSGITVMLAAGLTILLTTPIALSASAGHGYLASISVMIAAMLFTQLVLATGWGEYFPWSVPVLFAQGDKLAPVSFVIVILAGMAGLTGTLLWWERADETN